MLAWAGVPYAQSECWQYGNGKHHKIIVLCINEGLISWPLDGSVYFAPTPGTYAGLAGRSVSRTPPLSTVSFILRLYTILISGRTREDSRTE
jgi:hypothetical protein